MLLRIALELDLKRAMIGGVDRVYEIGRTFRNEGLDSTHAAEFSMLEAYEAYGDQHTMMALAQDLVRDAHRAIGSTVVPGRDGSEIDLDAEWRQAPILDLVSEAVGASVDVATDAETLRGYADKHDVELQPHWGAAEIVVELYEQLVEDTLVQPTFVMDYPEAVKPLAKPHRTTPGLNEAWDLIINGVELGAAYSELNDPVIQRERLEAQSRLAARRRPRGDGARRGLPQGDGVRHAARRRHRHRRRPGASAAHRRRCARRSCSRCCARSSRRLRSSRGRAPGGRRARRPRAGRGCRRRTAGPPSGGSRSPACRRTTAPARGR